FQAEDGIRDSSVTGVQTCALPILPRFSRLSPERRTRRIAKLESSGSMLARGSEERRVGERGKSRWWPDHLKKKIKSKRDNNGTSSGDKSFCCVHRRTALA